MVSNMDTAENSELEEPEDKSFVNQFIEADVKIWEQNNFVVSSKRSICKQTNNSYKFDLPKIEPRQNEECFPVKRETVLEENISDQEISIKDEYCEDVKIDSDENRTDIPETETELSKEDSKSIVCELIDGKKWHEGSIAEVLVEAEEIMKDAFAIQKGTCDAQIISLQKVHKKNKSNICSNSSPRKHECNHCAYKTVRKSNLKSHINSIHLGIKNHKCNHCDYGTTQKEILKRHVNMVHLGLKDVKCDQCDFQAIQKNILIMHMNSEHLGIKNHKCDQCDYETSKKYSLTVHKNSVHLGIKNHKCHHCGYKTSNRCYLTMHVNRIHLGIKSVKCSQCDYQTTDMAYLKRHMDRVHLQMKNLKCSQCDYRTGRKDRLKGHIDTVHLGIKTLECRYCDYQATQKYNLTRHINNVHLGINQRTM